MQVTVLGGSGGSPNTGAGCSGYLVRAGRTNVVLDLGPGTLLELRRHTDFRTLDAIVISHMHPDHMLDVLALQHALAYNAVRPARPTPLLLPPGGAVIHRTLTAAFGEMGEEPGFFLAQWQIDEYDPSGALTLGDLTLTFAPTVHYIPCWAVRARPAGGEGDLGYTADTGPTADLDGFFAGVRLLVAEGTLLEASRPDSPSWGSLTAAEAGALATRVGAETLVLTHLSEERGFEASRQAAARAFGGRLEVARPGLTVAW